MTRRRRVPLNTEQILFLLALALIGLFVWRLAGVRPLPEPPGTPHQPVPAVAGGFHEPSDALRARPVPAFWDRGVRNPFAPANAPARVLAAVTRTRVTFTPRRARARVRVDYRTTLPPLATFELTLPRNVSLIRLTGQDLPEGCRPDARDLGGRDRHYTVRPAAPAIESYALELELAWTWDGAGIAVPELFLPGVTHESGLIVLTARGVTLEVADARGLTPVPLDTLDAGLRTAGTLAAFRYRAHPYGLRLRRTEPATRQQVAEGDGNGGKPTFNRGAIAGGQGGGHEGGTDDGNGPAPPPAWRLPVRLTGIVEIAGRRSALFTNAADRVIRRFQGGRLDGVTIEKIGADSVRLRNRQGRTFTLTLHPELTRRD